MRKFLLPYLLISGMLCSAWGFFAHKQINRMAVYTLPAGMSRFYKNNIDLITEHAVDPDKRRYSDSLEAPRHFLDADHYGDRPFEVLPEKWADAVEKLTEDTLKAYGIGPWNIETSYYRLVDAFKAQDSARILRASSDLGHYVGDAHVPLHTSENYNGQLTNQVGIHGFWESRLPELFSSKYNFFVGRAVYIDDPLKEAWAIVRHTYTYKDSTLLIEARLNKVFPKDRKYTFTQRNGRVEKQYSEEYARRYHEALHGMVERQMQSSILKVGSFWFSAWVDAGQPDLNVLKKTKLTAAERRKIQKEEELSEKGRAIGRKEE